MQASLTPLSVLTEGDPHKKAAAARAFRQSILKSNLGGASTDGPQPPDYPSRPDRPELVPAKQLARRRLGSVEGRAALLHAIAHIELNAIDLAADMIARFADAADVSDRRDDFIVDWSSVCDDEARHFVMVCDRLNELGFAYGDFPAHGGLWDAAMNTRSDIAARLAIAPLVLEARGLDVTPGMIEKLIQAGDQKSAAVLQIIYEEEIGHVAIGMRWLRHVAEKRDLEPNSLFKRMVQEFFGNNLRPPFNVDAREKAGFPLSYYKDLSG